MRVRPKAILIHLIDVRSFILYFAVFNFILVWRWDASIVFTCAACPWYHPWRYPNEPTLLLAAALFLRLNRWWGYMVAMVVASCILGWVVYLFSTGESVMAGLRADWKIIQMWYPYFVGSWDSQYVFAAVIVFCSALYLTRYILRQNARLAAGG